MENLGGLALIKNQPLLLLPEQALNKFKQFKLIEVNRTNKKQYFCRYEDTRSARLSVEIVGKQIVQVGGKAEIKGPNPQPFW